MHEGGGGFVRRGGVGVGGGGANGETAKLKNILIKKLQQHYH